MPEAHEPFDLSELRTADEVRIWSDENHPDPTHIAQVLRPGPMPWLLMRFEGEVATTAQVLGTIHDLPSDKVLPDESSFTPGVLMVGKVHGLLLIGFDEGGGSVPDQAMPLRFQVMRGSEVVVDISSFTDEG